MDKNPYEAPITNAPPSADSEPRSKFDWSYISLGWAVLLFVIWTQHGMFAQFRSDIPIWLKYSSTAMTAVSVVILLWTIRGWRLILALPLVGYLIWIQYLVWTFYAGR